MICGKRASIRDAYDGFCPDASQDLWRKKSFRRRKKFFLRPKGCEKHFTFTEQKNGNFTLRTFSLTVIRMTFMKNQHDHSPSNIFK